MPAALALGLVCRRRRPASPLRPRTRLDVVKVRKNFYMIAGAGGNIGVQIGSDGIVLVNAGTAQASDRVLAELKKLTDLPIRYIINADAGRDFVGGNEKLAKAGLHHLHQRARQQRLRRRDDQRRPRPRSWRTRAC